MRTTAAETPPKPAFDTAQIAKGAQLSAIGDCRDCHTADGGRTFAGGRPLPTSFGTIHSTNITPDDETGIGRYTVDDFRRALREGVAHRGACHTPRNVATGATDSIASTASPRGR